jgi:hypothetical protein
MLAIWPQINSKASNQRIEPDLNYRPKYERLFAEMSSDQISDEKIMTNESLEVNAAKIEHVVE